MNLSRRWEIFTRKHFVGREDGENHFCPVYRTDAEECLGTLLVTPIWATSIYVLIMGYYGEQVLKLSQHDLYWNWPGYIAMICFILLLYAIRVVRRLYSYTDYHDRSYTMKTRPLRIIDVATGQEIGRNGYMKAMFGKEAKQ